MFISISFDGSVTPESWFVERREELKVKRDFVVDELLW